METSQVITIILSSSVISGVALKTIDWVRDARAGQLQKRRAEVDRAITDRDKALTDLETAEAAEDAQARRARLVEEALAVHRRVIIDAPCLGPQHLPSYPSRKD